MAPLPNAFSIAVMALCRALARLRVLRCTSAALQQVFVQTEAKSAHATWREVAGQLEKSAQAVTEMMDEAEAVCWRTSASRRRTV